MSLPTSSLRVAAALLATGQLALPALAAPPVIDGLFDDWSSPGTRAEAVESPPGTALFVRRAWSTRTDERLCLSFELDEEVSIQQGNDLELLIDTDRNPATGYDAGGVGADFVWSFGKRQGRAYVLGLPVRVRPGDVGLRQAPTVSSRRFEVSFDLRSRAAGGNLFPRSDVVALLCAGKRSHRSCTALLSFPAEAGGAAPAPARVARENLRQLRLLTYNVLFDGLFKRREIFARILKALAPDVILFQEVFNHTPEETRVLLAETLPGAEWQAVGSGKGVMLSRYPIQDWGLTGGDREGLWARLVPPNGEWPEGPLILNLHPPCCENEAGRQVEIDRTMAWLRKARAAGTVHPGTPILVAGDMNLVGRAAQLTTLLTGAISDTVTWGPPWPPDGDGTALADVRPYHTTGLEAYTWRNDDSSYAPGRLGYILYSDSVLRLGRHFVLWTPDMTAADLEALGLRAEDTALASDHLPVVADFSPGALPSR